MPSTNKARLDQRCLHPSASLRTGSAAEQQCLKAPPFVVGRLRPEATSSLSDGQQGQTYPVWPPTLGAQWVSGEPIMLGGNSWDMAFELTSNVPDPDKPSRADLNWDGIVDFKDLAILLQWWLRPDP